MAIKSAKLRMRTGSCLAGVATMALVATQVPAQADVGAALLSDWATAGDSSEIFDLSYGAVSETGPDVIVSDMTVRLSAAGLANFFRPFFPAEDADGNDVDAALVYVISFPEVTFTNLRSTNESVSMDAVQADTMELTFEGAGPASATSTYSDVVGEELSFAVWPDAEPNLDAPLSALVPLFRAIIDVDAAALRIGRVESAVSGADGIALNQTYQGMVMEDVVDGNFGTLTIDGVTVTAQEEGGSNTAEFLMNIGKMNARDYNYATLLDAYLTDRVSTADTPYETAIGLLEINDMQVVVPQEETSFSIGRFAFEDVGVRPAEVDLLAGLDELIKAAASGGPEPDEEEIVSTVGSIYGNLSLGLMSIENLAFATPNDASGVVEAITVAGLNSTGMQEAGVTGLNIVGQDGEVVQMGRWALEGLTFPPLIAMMKLEEAMDEGDIDAILEGMPTLARVVQNDIRIIVPEDDVNMSLDSSIFEMLDHVGPIPTGLRIGMDGLRLDVASLDPSDREPFEKLGLSSIVATLDGLLKWERETSDVNLDFLGSVEQLGTLSGEATVGNVPAIVFERPDQSSVFALLGATFKDIELNFDDDGVVERGLKIAADEEGMSYEAMELRVKGIIPVLLSELGDADLAARVSDALTAVIENGSGLTLRAVASTPLPIAAMAAAAENPASLVNMIEVEIENR